MTRCITTALLLLCGAAAAHAQFFDSLSRPSVWFRADRSTLTPLKWTDVSGHKRDAVALAGENPVNGGLLNFNKSILFDGANDYLKVPVSLEGLTDFTILTVFQSADTTERGTWGAENALSRDVMLTTRRAKGPETITTPYGKSENQPVLSTIVQSWEGTPSASATAHLALGSAGKLKGHRPFKGLVAEMMVFARSLGFLERLQVETYLALKYGVPMNGRNYISSDGKVLWKAEENSAYAHRIAGMGRDDAFQLYQKQSASAYDSGLLTFSVGPLAASNEQNRSPINPGDLFVWGDNNGAHVAKPGEGKDSVLSFVQRKWVLTATGNTASQLATELQVDVSRFSKATLGYWLVIDRSGNGNFDVDNLEYLQADRTTPDGKAVYKVKWDTDRSGMDAFGFARAVKLFAMARTIAHPTCTDENAGHVRVEVIAGTAPYRYTFSGAGNKVISSGMADKGMFEQKELTTGRYSFAIEDGTGDDLARDFTLTMSGALDVDLGADKKLPKDGGEVVLALKSPVPYSTAVTYQWQDNFGSSSTTDYISVKSSGVYTLTVTRLSDGCAFSDQVTVTGSEEQKLAVFPNLIRQGDAYNVGISLPEVGSVSVQVFDMKGTAHQSMSGENQSEYHFKATLNESGMYMVVIRTPQGTESRKVIVQ
jgi:hypothetical protein